MPNAAPTPEAQAGSAPKIARTSSTAPMDRPSRASARLSAPPAVSAVTAQYGSSMPPRMVLVTGFTAARPESSLSTTVAATAAAEVAVRIS